MNRAFLSLYLLIALFVAFMGWGLDKIWQYFSPPPIITSAQKDLLSIIEGHIANKTLSHFTENIEGDVLLLSTDDFASTPFSDQLKSGEPILLHNSEGELQLYKRITGQNHIIRLTLPPENHPRDSYIYEILLTLFYISIGLAVFLWVWPLMRDVRKLEKHTQHIGKNTLPKPVNVLPGSAVSNLASAFNKMAARIKELLASHREMTYAVSHELRTPLARMKFALAMLQDIKPDENKDNLNAESTLHLKSLLQDVDEMEALITQLLSYAGYQQEDGPLVQENGDMAFLASELIRRAKASHQHNSIAVILESEENATKMTCDWHLMERAIFNLINNGLRFAQTKIIVNLRTTETHYIVQVEDDGPGIPTDDKERIFDSFVRLDSKHNTQARGFGLGLAIVKRVLKWHDGAAKVEASENGGALFTLEWPKV